MPEPLDILTYCEAIAAFERATGHSLPHHPPPPPAAAAAPPADSAGRLTVDLAPPGDLRAALVSRTILYSVTSSGPTLRTGSSVAPSPASARRPRGAFSATSRTWWRRPGRRRRCAARPIRCGSTPPPTASAECYPAPGAGFVRPPDSAAPARRSGRAHPDFQIGRWLVTA